MRSHIYQDIMENLQYMKMNIGYFFPKKSTTLNPCTLSNPVPTMPSMPVPHSIGSLSHSAQSKSMCIESDRNAELASMTAFSSTKMEIKTKPKFQRSHSLTSGLDLELGMNSRFDAMNNWVPSQEDFQINQPNLTLIRNADTRIHIHTYLDSVPSDSGSHVRVDEIRYQDDTNTNNRRTFIKRYSEPPTVKELKMTLPYRFNKDVDSHTAKCSTIGLVRDTSLADSPGQKPKETEAQTVTKTVSSKIKDNVEPRKEITTTVHSKRDSESVVITTTRREHGGLYTRIVETDANKAQEPAMKEAEPSANRKDKVERSTVRKDMATSRIGNITPLKKENPLSSSPRDLNFHPSKEKNRQIINDLDRDNATSTETLRTKSRVSLKFLNVQSSETVVQNS